MKQILLLSAFLLIYSNSFMFSQDDTEYSLEDSLQVYENKPRIGGFVHLGYDIHLGDFSGIPGIPSCCPSYKFGMAPGLSVGVLYEKHITDTLGLSFRLGYHTMNGKFQSIEPTWVILNGEQAEGEFTHYFNTNIGAVSLEALGSYKIWREMDVYAGLNFGVITNADYSQYEQITKPADRATFLNGKQIQNDTSGSIDAVRRFQCGLTLGAGYPLPMNALRSLFIVPEIFYSFYFTPPVKQTVWFAQSIKVGVSVKYKQPPPPPQAPDPPMEPASPRWLPDPPVLPAITADITAQQLDSAGNVKKDANLVIEDFVSLNVRPLLNYIFFEENSAQLQNKYIKLSNQETNNFSDKDLVQLDVLDTYYQALNIIGMRLRNNPDVTITLLGTNSNSGSEKGNLALSEQRAQTVKNYFTEVWSIDPSRIKIKAVNLPPKKSDDSDSPEYAAQENRRVEILSSSDILSEAVITTDTKRTISADKIQFLPKVNSQIDVESWKVDAMQGDKVLSSFSAQGTPPEILDWNIDANSKNSPTTSGNITYCLDVKDKLGRLTRSKCYNLPVEQITIKRKRVENIQDKEFEYYSLILFDYGKSNLLKEHSKVLDFIKGRISPNAVVYVKGYTDQMGDELTNDRIADKRAKSVGDLLKINKANVIGLGEKDALFDNSTPEGRFYCRTVRIEIETPVEK